MDQLRDDSVAEQLLYFRFIDSTIGNSKPFSHLKFSVPVGLQPSLLWIWSETPNTGCLAISLKYE